MNSRSRKMLACVFIPTIAVIGIITGIVLYPFEVDRITSRVDLSQETPYRITPVWNTLNIWDVDFFRVNNPDAYRAKYPYVDRLILMTATGGRSSRINDYYTEDASGNPTYNFTPLCRALQWVYDANITPVIVIGNTPHDLARLDPGETWNYGAFDALTHPPRDWNKYYNYIHAIALNLTGTFGAANASSWEWRVMTEPDNKDWWTGTWEEYFWLYVNSTRAIRAVIPGARVGIGNLMEEDDIDRINQFVIDIQRMAPDALPNITGYSCYGRGQVGPYPSEIGQVASNWNRVLRADLAPFEFEQVIEEGQILVDEAGHRLWSGDGTELGAAWQAAVIQQCILQNVSRYVQWEFRASELPAPSYFVHEMYEKLEGHPFFPLNMVYPWRVKPHQRHVDGFASWDANASVLSLLVYSHDVNRHSSHSTTVDISVILPPELSTSISTQEYYRIDHDHSNFFTDWLAFSEDLERIVPNEAGGGSRYDLGVGINLKPEDQNTWYTWQWEHRNDYALETVDRDLHLTQTGSTLGFQVPLDANAVSLVRFFF